MSARPNEPLASLVFTPAFLRDLVGHRFNDIERKKFMKALELLEANERHRSLEVHQLTSDLSGVWAAKADDALRLLFQRLPEGRKLLLSCSRHYRK